MRVVESLPSSLAVDQRKWHEVVHEISTGTWMVDVFASVDLAEKSEEKGEVEISCPVVVDWVKKRDEV